jgi:hypothetical protein
MRRIFWNPIAALLAAACFRLFFLLKFPAGSGDAVVYEQIATNWLQHHVFAMSIGDSLMPVDLRMPGYPAFLALVYVLTGRTGEAARFFVGIAQILVDVATCVVIGAFATLLALLARPRPVLRDVYMPALWLAAFCPFTAHYVVVPLTETWAILFTAVALVVLSLLVSRACDFPGHPATRSYRLNGLWEGTALAVPKSSGNSGILAPELVRAVGQSNDEIGSSRSASSVDFLILAALSGFVVGLGTLFRPETPLLLIVAFLVLAYLLLRAGAYRHLLLSCMIMLCGFALSLLPWMIRNAITLHEFQPLAPKDTMLPGEVDPKGFLAWEGTWLYRFRDCYLVSWKLNGEEIRLQDLPPWAFDTDEERDRVAAVLEKYNDELTWTADEDAVFAQLARERTARHPLRTYLWIPLRRAARIWFTPRIELLPFSGNVFPLAYMREEDPVDQRVTVSYFFLNIIYVVLGVAGAWKLWRYPGVRPAVAFIILYILIRTAFLTTLETPEPRYVLVCFPALIAFAAQLFQRNTPSPDYASSAGSG